MSQKLTKTEAKLLDALKHLVDAYAAVTRHDDEHLARAENVIDEVEADEAKELKPVIVLTLNPEDVQEKLKEGEKVTPELYEDIIKTITRHETIMECFWMSIDYCVDEARMEGTLK